VLRTSPPLSALAVVLQYRNLLTGERSFLAAKTLLSTRPIFHRTDAAIRGHIFILFWLWRYGTTCSTDWPPAARRNGTASSTI
jgi:hypothetical protein